MRRALLGIGLCTALLLGACGGDDGADTSSPPSSGGLEGLDESELDLDATIRFAHSQPPEVLDPHKERQRGDRMFTFPVFDRLVGIGTDDDPQALEPMLATSWEFNDDATELTLTLRDDVTFHDGAAFDAEVVKRNIEDAMSERASPFIRDSLSTVEAVEVLDPTHVVLRFKSPSSHILYVLATGAGAMISPDALDDPDGLTTDPGNAGSGAYLVVEFEPLNRIFFERSADPYWNDDGGRVKRLEFHYVTEGQTKVAGLQSGEFDLVHLVTAQLSSVPALERAGFTVTPVDSWVTQAATIRSGRGSMRDLRVRQAFAHSIDKQQIGDQLFDGNCEAAAQVFPRGMWAHDPDFEDPYPHDPEAAKRLLADAGVPNLKFELLTGAGGSYEQVAIAHQAMLKQQLGLDASLLTVQNSETRNVFSENTVDVLYQTLPLEADPAAQVRFLLNQGFGDEAVERRIRDLAEAALREGTNEAQAPIYRELARYVAEEALVVPVCQGRQAYVGKDEIVGVGNMPQLFQAAPDFSQLAMRK